MRPLYKCLALLCLLALPLRSEAEPVPGVPSELVPWVEWVKERHPEWRCPRVGGEYQCVWPGHTILILNADGAEFEVTVETFDDGYVELPGSGDVLPFAVKVLAADGKEVDTSPLLQPQAIPAVYLQAGRYGIKGRFIWSRRPRELRVPQYYGLIMIAEAGAVQMDSRLSKDGMLWLGAREEERSDDSLAVRVARKLVDGSPLTVETRIEFDVAGTVRSLDIGRVVPAGLTPVHVLADLPYQLSEQGDLSLQVRPGQHVVRVIAVSSPRLPALELPAVKLPQWPREEVLSFFPDSELRTLSLEGAQPVQPGLTHLPQDWHGEAAFQLESGGTLVLNELRRGEARPEANVLTLARQAWLDLDGKGLTFVDTVNGTMNQGWRLNALPQLGLSSVTVNGEPQLITQDPAAKLAGIELRTKQVSLSAVSRLARTLSLPAGGWAHSFRSVSTRFHLPPGWRLLHAGGVDRAYGSWLSSWSLLDFFLTLLISIAAAKLFGRVVGLITLASLLLNHTEFLAPRLLLAHLLVAFAWTRLIESPNGFFGKAAGWYARATFLAWAVAVLSFSKLQVTQLLFPQLQAGTRYRTVFQHFLAAEESTFLAWPICFFAVYLALHSLTWPLMPRGWWRKALTGLLTAGTLLLILFGAGALLTASYSFTQRAAPAPLAGGYEVQKRFDNIAAEIAQESYSGAAPGKLYSPYPERQTQQRLKAAAAAQTGSAEPNWRWREFLLEWQGDVAPEHAVSLYLLSPFWNRLLSGVRILLMLLLAAGLIRPLVPLGNAKVSALALLFLLFPRGAAAEPPPMALLEELEKRLAETRCDAREEACAAIAEARISLARSQADLELVVSSREESGVGLPGPLEQLAIDTVLVDEKESAALRRDARGFLWVKVPEGRSRVRLRGRLLSMPVATLQFPQQPLHVSVNAGEWGIEGLSETGRVHGSLRLVHAEGRGGQLPELTARELPSWLIVTRSVRVDIDTRVHTSVTRIGDTRRAEAVKLPLLPGEQVTAEGVAVQGNEIALRFNEGAREVAWESVLPVQNSLALTAGAEPRVSEVWELSCGIQARCGWEGIVPVRTTVGNEHRLRWKPFPQESVSVSIEELAPAKGDSLTVDSVRHEVSWGSRMRSGDLQIALRTTVPSNFGVTLPEGVTLRAARLDGSETQALVEGRKAAVLVNPGPHQLQFQYEGSWSPSLRESAPPIELTAPAHNVAIAVKPSGMRWLLWTGGLRWGPAVLFWSKLAFLAIFAVVLSRSKLLPFGAAAAAVLCFGVATLPIAWIFLPLAWLIAMNYREKLRRMPLPRPLVLAAFVTLALISLIVLYEAVRRGLIIDPPMLIAGNGSNSGSLNWYLDHGSLTLPQPWVLSAPLWVWRAVMLGWSAWLVVLLFGWLKLTLATVREIRRDE